MHRDIAQLIEPGNLYYFVMLIRPNERLNENRGFIMAAIPKISRRYNACILLYLILLSISELTEANTKSNDVSTVCQIRKLFQRSNFYGKSQLDSRNL